ncbi:GldG family protein [Paenibacillus sp. P96]|uniref:GldG family protein n=1 Tax=Paenibacillus zeirhizosphaerae TaxID=2987519 RepID=A0ABT9FUT5_9BACL|nr:GldG family protein [Paenibacillus sp. P96]MDP4098498.1 GldG family protein [Paenibacillus sp. P96]
MKKWLSRTNSLILSAALIGIFILLTLFLRSLSGFQLDLSAGRQYTLSDQTLTVLKSLTGEVRVLSFTVGSSANQRLNQDVSDMLNEYKKHSSKLKIEQHDLNQEPALAQQYSVSSASIVLEQGEQRRTIDIGTLFRAVDQEGNYEFSGEEQLTSAMMTLSSDEQHKLAFLTGHEEIPLSSMTGLNSALQQGNVTAVEVQLNRDGAVPEDADVLAIIGPQRDISAAELKAIRAYLSNGGKLLLALGFNQEMKSAWTNIDELASDYGVSDLHAVTVDNKQTSTLGPLWVVPSFGDHDITRKLAESNLFPMLSLSLGVQAGEQSKWQLTSLLQSSEDSYAETNIQGLINNETEFNEGQDTKGPVDIGFAADTQEGEPKAVILGTSSLFSDTEFMNGGNRDFALNTLNYLRGQSNDLTIRPRQQQDYEYAYLTPVQARIVFVTSVAVIPLLFAAVGLLLWWRRRKA